MSTKKLENQKKYYSCRIDTFFLKEKDKTAEVKKMIDIIAKIISFVVLAIILSGMLFLYKRVPSALVPDEDQGIIMGIFQYW